MAWARASFEQGALPSLLFLQGIAPIFTLPGDRMFQATGLCHNKQRPPIMHAYGGAKTGMAINFCIACMICAWPQDTRSRPHQNAERGNCPQEPCHAWIPLAPWVWSVVLDCMDAERCLFCKGVKQRAS